MSALNKISMAIAGLFGVGAAAMPLSNRNGFIDGAFETSASASVSLGTTPAYGTAAMWMASAGTGGAGTLNTVQIRSGSPGTQAGLDSGVNNVLQLVQTTASTGTFAARTLPLIFQKCEWVNKYAGKSVTLSFKLWANAPVTVPGVIGSQFYGTGGSPTASAIFDKAVNWAVTASPKRFSVRLDVPSMSGVTLGTNGNDYTQLGVYFPSGWTGTIYIGEPQVELCNPNASSDITGSGGLATCFEYRGYGPELARVSRYFQQFGSPFGAGTFSSATQGFYEMNYPGGPMRAAPAASFNGTFQCSYPGNNVTVAGTNMAATGQNVQASMLTAVVSGMTPGQGSVLWGNSGATVTLDARL